MATFYYGVVGMKYKEAYNHAVSIIAELERENRKLKQLVAVAIMTKGEEE